MAHTFQVSEIYGDFTVIGIIKSSHNKRKLMVKCNICKREKTVLEGAFQQNNGIYHKSCGKGLKCQDKRFYTIWEGMRSRTKNPNYHAAHRYSERAISSDEFKYFIDFYDYLYDSYVEHCNKYGIKNTELDRIDNDGGYVKGNLRWTNRKTQVNNSSVIKKFKAISPEGKEYVAFNQTDFAIEHNLNPKQVNAVLRKRFKSTLGWKFEYIN